jgi:hypothetical protein
MVKQYHVEVSLVSFLSVSFRSHFVRAPLARMAIVAGL